MKHCKPCMDNSGVDEIKKMHLLTSIKMNNSSNRTVGYNTLIEPRNLFPSYEGHQTWAHLRRPYGPKLLAHISNKQNQHQESISQSFPNPEYHLRRIHTFPPVSARCNWHKSSSNKSTHQKPLPFHSTLKAVPPKGRQPKLPALSETSWRRRVELSQLFSVKAEVDHSVPCAEPNCGRIARAEPRIMELLMMNFENVS